MFSPRRERHERLLYEYKMGRNVTDAYKNLKKFYDKGGCYNQKECKSEYERFKNGDYSFDGEVRSPENSYGMRKCKEIVKKMADQPLIGRKRTGATIAMVIDLDDPENKKNRRKKNSESTTMMKMEIDKDLLPASESNEEKEKKVAPKRASYAEMIADAILAHEKKSGSAKCSKAVILEHIFHHYTKEKPMQINAHLCKALKAGVEKGELNQVSGSGASGSFTLVDKSARAKKAAKPKKTVITKVPKTAKNSKKPSLKTKVQKPKPKRS